MVDEPDSNIGYDYNRNFVTFGSTVRKKTFSQKSKLLSWNNTDEAAEKPIEEK